MNFEESFRHEILQLNPDHVAEKLWTEISKSYTQPGRHYHNLLHLEKMHVQLSNVRNQISDWQTIVFSFAYHDIIYNPLKKNNEEKSAALAIKRMTELRVSPQQIEKCRLQILATKSHQLSSDVDTNLFTDADLSILGTDPTSYLEYTSQIRKEYSYFPDMIYKPGRKKVLLHFLSMEHIFKTDYFRNNFENKARANITSELTEL